jgi:tRNA A37 threonylcarbamoyladenosine synthetase subunit TsaC/SUA5/YrdC
MLFCSVLNDVVGRVSTTSPRVLQRIMMAIKIADRIARLGTETAFAVSAEAAAHKAMAERNQE